MAIRGRDGAAPRPRPCPRREPGCTGAWLFGRPALRGPAGVVGGSVLERGYGVAERDLGVPAVGMDGVGVGVGAVGAVELEADDLGLAGARHATARRSSRRDRSSSGPGTRVREERRATDTRRGSVNRFTEQCGYRKRNGCGRLRVAPFPARQRGNRRRPGRLPCSDESP
ncbi:hypothetical protein GCM10010425_65610 [Streptomyces spororaveus]